MNIFEILSQGKGAINEENVSAFLAYLLNPNETHGFKNEFFKRFINLLGDNQISEDDTFDVSNVQLEVPFFDKNSDKKRVMDIFIECSSGINGKYIIAIENKIDVSAIQQDQLREESEYIRNNYSIDDYKIDHFKFIFLTPSMDCGKNVTVPDEKTCSYMHISWKDHIIPILKNLLDDELTCKISPVTDYVKQTLRAFICYINNFNEPVLKNVESFEMYSDNDVKTFCLKQYSNYQVKLYKDTKEVSVYSAIYNLVNYLYDEKINEKVNTRYLGHLLVNYLNSSDNRKKLDEWNKIRSNPNNS